MTDTSNAASKPPQIIKTFRMSSDRKTVTIELVLKWNWPRCEACRESTR